MSDVPLGVHVDARLADICNTLEERQLRVEVQIKALADAAQVDRAAAARALDERRMEFEGRFQSMTEAGNLARIDLERRLTHMNAMRAQLDRQAATFVSRDMYDERNEALLKRVGMQERAADNRFGHLEQLQSRMIGYVLGAAALVSVLEIVRWWLAGKS